MTLSVLREDGDEKDQEVCLLPRRREAAEESVG